MRFKNNDSLSLSCIARKNKATKAFVVSLCFFLSRLLVNFRSIFFLVGLFFRTTSEREKSTNDHTQEEPTTKKVAHVHYIIILCFWMFITRVL